MNNKKPKGWILCQSKSFPGHFYYFNLSTGAAHWSLSDDQNYSIRKDIQKADVSDNYPEPNSPLEISNIFNNSYIENKKEKLKGNSQQALFAQTNDQQYISNVSSTPKRSTIQKSQNYFAQSSFGKVTFPKYLSLPMLESDAGKEIFKPGTQTRSRYKLNSSKVINKFDRIGKTNIHNKIKNMPKLLKEPILKKNPIGNYFTCSNSKQNQSNGIYRFSSTQSNNNYQKNHLNIKEQDNEPICRSVGTQTLLSIPITENKLQYTLESRELQKNIHNHNFSQNNTTLSNTTDPTLCSLRLAENGSTHTDKSDARMKTVDSSEHTFQLNPREKDNNNDNYQNIPMDIETYNLERIHIISNNDIPINTEHSIDQSHSDEMPGSNKSDTTVNKYLHTFKESNRNSSASVFYFRNQLNSLQRDTFDGENEINDAIKNVMYITEKSNNKIAKTKNDKSSQEVNTCPEVQDLRADIQNGKITPDRTTVNIEDQNAFDMKTLDEKDLRYVLKAKQKTKSETVGNNKKQVTFALDQNSVIENGNNTTKNVFNSRNKVLEGITVKVKNNIKEDGNILKDTRRCDAYGVKNKVQGTNVINNIKRHVDNSCTEEYFHPKTLRLRVDRNETNQLRVENEKPVSNSNNYCDYQISNFEHEYERHLNNRGSPDRFDFKKPNSNFEFEHEHRVYNIDNSLRRFDIDCKEIEERVKLRVDEWVCCFTQIMEDFLEDVVKQNSIELDPPAPWAFDEILARIKAIYIKNAKITAIVDRIVVLFREIQFRNRNLKSNLKADYVTKMIGCGLLLLESFEEILPYYSPDTYQNVSHLLRLICDPKIEPIEPLVIDNPRNAKEYDGVERYNVVKSRTEILEYLKKHHPSWLDYSEDTNGKISKDSQHIIRTIGRNLKSLKIDKNNNLTVYSSSKLKQNEATKLSSVVSNDRNDVTVDNNKNVNDSTKIGPDNDVNTDKNPGLGSDNCDFVENDIRSKHSNDKNTPDVKVYDDVDIGRLTIGDNCQNVELAKANVEAVETDNCQSLEESVNTYALIKLFLIHLSKVLTTIYRFLHDNVTLFRENKISLENKLLLREKISKTHAYLENIIIKLKRIIERETNDTELKTILANYSEALEDVRVIKYRNVVMKSLEQALILQKAMKTMLHVVNESNSPVSSYSCDNYFNIFE